METMCLRVKNLVAKEANNNHSNTGQNSCIEFATCIIPLRYSTNYFNTTSFLLISLHLFYGSQEESISIKLTINGQILQHGFRQGFGVGEGYFLFMIAYMSYLV